MRTTTRIETHDRLAPLSAVFEHEVQLVAVTLLAVPGEHCGLCAAGDRIVDRVKIHEQSIAVRATDLSFEGHE